eukprot:g53537.t1
MPSKSDEYALLHGKLDEILKILKEVLPAFLELKTKLERMEANMEGAIHKLEASGRYQAQQQAVQKASEGCFATPKSTPKHIAQFHNYIRSNSTNVSALIGCIENLSEEQFESLDIDVLKHFRVPLVLALKEPATSISALIMASECWKKHPRLFSDTSFLTEMIGALQKYIRSPEANQRFQAASGPQSTPNGSISKDEAQTLLVELKQLIDEKVFRKGRNFRTANNSM